MYESCPSTASLNYNNHKHVNLHRTHVWRLSLHCPTYIQDPYTGKPTLNTMNEGWLSTIPLTYNNNKNFLCCWPWILVIFNFMFQLNAPFLYYIYHIPLHFSSNFMLNIRRIHCIHTASGSMYVALKKIEWFS